MAMKDEVSSRAALVDEVRGVTGADERRSLATGLVIGVGGSGVQTISRLRAAINSSRPDAASVANVRFLGIDAVEVNKQYPELPAGVSLRANEYLNITRRGFNPGTFIKSHQPTSDDLKRWWDTRYQPPMSDLTDGLKRSRMLGRLAFYWAAGELQEKIELAVRDARALHGEHVAQGLEGGNRAKLPVYVVASSCGGTGSSGFLEVVHKIHLAAESAGVDPEIRAFLYLPGVFRYATRRDIGGAVLGPAHEANAYAFFRELDHFMDHAETFGEQVARPGSTKINVPKMSLLKQVYVIDNTLDTSGDLSLVTDSYEIVAEAIYQFAMTSVGQPIQTVKATNVDVILQSADNFGKRRWYSSLGIARIVLPGETLRRHLSYRFADWFVREALLFNPTDLGERTGNHPRADALLNYVKHLSQEVSTTARDEAVAEFEAWAVDAPDVLEEDPTPSTATRVLSELQRLRPAAISELNASFDAVSRAKLPLIEPKIIDTVAEAGLGLRFGVRALLRLERAINDSRRRVEEQQAEALQRASASWEDIDETERLLRKLAGRPAFLRLLPGQKEAAKKLGDAIREWGLAVLAGERAGCQLRFLDDAYNVVRKNHLELDQAIARLLALSQRLDVQWHADDLIGKDAGPFDTTTLIPGDIRPEVEDSTMAKLTFERVEADVEAARGSEPVVFPIHVTTAFLRGWTSRSVLRGPFSYGCENGDEWQSAEAALLDLLDESAHQWAVQGADGRTRLPADLVAAAERAGGSQLLNNAIRGLGQLSKAVCWHLDRAHLSLPDPFPNPEVKTVISRHQSSLRDFDGVLNSPDCEVADADDPERVVAISIEWGAPAHTIAQVQHWKAVYEQALELFERDPIGNAPPHLDRRWASGPEQLSSLVPEYFTRDLAADALAKSLFGTWILERAAGGHANAVQPFLKQFPSGLASETPKGPVFRESVGGDHFEYRGVLYKRVGRALERTKELIDLGRSLESAMSAIGESTELQNSVEAFITILADNVTPSEIRAHVDTFANDVLKAEYEKAEADSDRAHLLGELYDALADWSNRLIELDGSI